MNSQTRISHENLRVFCRKILQALGVPEDDAAIVADCLVAANLYGIDSHGVIRLAHYVVRLENGSINPRPQMRFERNAPGLGVVDGDHGLGHVVMRMACDRVRDLAQENGTASVAVKNSSHFGMTGYYIRYLTGFGLAAMAMTATDALLVPFGGRKPMWGTNPIAFGFPARDIPVVLDMATTSIPYGKIALAQKEGRPIPPEWGLDSEGNPTEDPGRIAGLHPIAGPKGSGLAMIIDVFSNLFVGMAFGPHIVKMYGEMAEKRRLGHFVAAWDVSRLTSLDSFTDTIEQMKNELHAIPPADGIDRVLFPGEIEELTRKERLRTGIPLEAGIHQELQGLSTRFTIEL